MSDEFDKSVLKFLQLYIQCLRKKILDLIHHNDLLGADIICVSEHWLTNAAEFATYVMDDFVPGSSFCGKSYKNIGAYIFDNM